MPDTRLTCSPPELNDANLDVLVIGSGPASTALTERLYEKHPHSRIGVLERGGVLTLTHINNIFTNEHRRPFIEEFNIKPWEGTFAKGGMLIPALGGRGIAAGAHLRRFDDTDFDLWPNGKWPREVVDDLPRYYSDAELNRRVSTSSLRGPAQTWALGTLHNLHAYPPPVGVDLWSAGGFSVGRGYDSSVSRLWRLLLTDRLRHENQRVYVATNAYATRLIRDGSEIKGVEYYDGALKRHADKPLKASVVVLAASTIESARLVLNSNLLPGNTPVGAYLAEHIERRAKILVRAPTGNVQSQGISVVIPPENGGRGDRFQIHLRGQPDSTGNLVIDIGGFAAMDPSPANRVTLSDNPDGYGVLKANTQVSLSTADEERTRRMCDRIRFVARILGGRFVTERFPFEDVQPRYTDSTNEIQHMELGRSYHESGTLRMGSDAKTAVTTPNGKLHNVDNLYVADAALFPSVGIANPMLTITALAYRVADKIGDTL